jgi:hypothetical protein
MRFIVSLHGLAPFQRPVTMGRDNPGSGSTELNNFSGKEKPQPWLGFSRQHGGRAGYFMQTSTPAPWQLPPASVIAVPAPLLQVSAIAEPPWLQVMLALPRTT